MWFLLRLWVFLQPEWDAAEVNDGKEGENERPEPKSESEPVLFDVVLFGRKSGAVKV